MPAAPIPDRAWLRLARDLRLLARATAPRSRATARARLEEELGPELAALLVERLAGARARGGA